MADSMTSSVVVRVRRDRTPQEMLNAIGRKQNIDKTVVDAMPCDGNGEEEVEFFQLGLSKRGGLISNDDLEKEFKLRRLKPDPYAVAAVNEVHPDFVVSHPNCTHWKDRDGNWCCIAFYWNGDMDMIGVIRCGRGWHNGWWFGGVRLK